MMDTIDLLSSRIPGKLMIFFRKTIEGPVKSMIQIPSP
jgi:hypothetical protein